MRLVYGEPPRSEGFHPETEGWTPLREPSARMLGLMGGLLGLPLAAGIGWLWLHMPVDLGIHFDLRPLARHGRLVFTVVVALVPLLAFALLILLHEISHALGCPRLGFTRDTIIGVWPSRLLFYAGHVRAMGRIRYLWHVALPFVLLTAVPMAACAFAGGSAAGWFLLSLANALVAGGDVILFFLIASQVPRGAAIRNQGWHTWWKAKLPPQTV